MGELADAASAAMALLALIMLALGKTDYAVFIILYAIWLQRSPAR